MKISTVAEGGTALHRPLFPLLGGCRSSHTFSSHRFYYNFTEITITTPRLTSVLDSLIGGGISLCCDGV